LFRRTRRPKSTREFPNPDEWLVHAINALNPKHKPFALQFVAAWRAEGVSRIASAFASAAADASGAPVLLVDCSADGKEPSQSRTSVPSLVATYRQTATIDAAISLSASSPDVKLARLSNEPAGRFSISPSDLQSLVDLTRTKFAIVVFDCPPALSHPLSLALARCCDGTALVVRADWTPRVAVRSAKRAIESFGGQVIGVVLNRHQTVLSRSSR
jgi:Mrp family chromosome partitioning ATPase